MTNSTGTIGLVAPTVDITRTGQEEVLDGVRIVFQLTPGHRVPGRDELLLPRPSGPVHGRERHPQPPQPGHPARRARSATPGCGPTYLDEAIDLFAAETDVAFASHHWPTWGGDRVAEYLSLQRDLYAYLHDQTLRLMNKGLNGAEAAEAMDMPPALEQAWHTHGYYGSVSHNVKAVYQRYLGWFDGNPARLWPHPPVEASLRYVACMGGADAVVATAADLRRRRRPAVRRRATRPGGLRRSRPRGGQGAAGRGLRASGLRRGERDLAQLLPDGRPRAAPRHGPPRRRPSARPSSWRP